MEDAFVIPSYISIIAACGYHKRRARHTHAHTHKTSHSHYTCTGRDATTYCLLLSQIIRHVSCHWQDSSIALQALWSGTLYLRLYQLPLSQEYIYIYHQTHQILHTAMKLIQINTSAICNTEMPINGGAVKRSNGKYYYTRPLTSHNSVLMLSCNTLLIIATGCLLKHWAGIAQSV